MGVSCPKYSWDVPLRYKERGGGGGVGRSVQPVLGRDHVSTYEPKSLGLCGRFRFGQL